MQEVDTTKTIELEEKYDPEMRFRPLLPPASLVVGGLLIVLSCFHYYTAGFGLLRETTHRGHPPRVRPGPRLPGVSGAEVDAGKGAAALVARPGRRAPRRLDSGTRHRGFRPLHPVDLRGPRVSRGQSASARRGDGLDPRRPAARGDATGDGLAAARDRPRLHGLRAGRAGVPGPPQALRRAVVVPRQPPVHDEPGHLRHRGRRGGDVRVPLRAVRRARHAHRPGAALHRHRVVDRRALRRRAREGQRLRVGALRHAVGLVGRQRGDGRLADHPRDDPPGLSAAFRGARSRPRRPPAARSRRRSWAPRRS